MLLIKNLNKFYDATQVLFDINLDIENGDIFGFIGQNGAGKTTTIKSIVGLLDFKGEILVNNFDIKKEPIKAKESFAYIPDNPEVYEFMKGIQYLNFIADIFRVSKDERDAKIKKYSEIFNLSDKLNAPIFSYSHGMKQKIVIISALIHNPKLLILDEPFVGLDPTSIFYLKNQFKEMAKDNTAIFFSTHILEVAQELCNKIAIIKKGHIIEKGLVKDLCVDSTLEEKFMELMRDE